MAINNTLKAKTEEALIYQEVSGIATYSNGELSVLYDEVIGHHGDSDGYLVILKKENHLIKLFIADDIAIIKTISEEDYKELLNAIKALQPGLPKSMQS